MQRRNEVERKMSLFLTYLVMELVVLIFWVVFVGWYEDTLKTQREKKHFIGRLMPFRGGFFLCTLKKPNEVTNAVTSATASEMANEGASLSVDININVNGMMQNLNFLGFFEYPETALESVYEHYKNGARPYLPVSLTVKGEKRLRFHIDLVDYYVFEVPIPPSPSSTLPSSDGVKNALVWDLGEPLKLFKTERELEECFQIRHGMDANKTIVKYTNSTEDYNQACEDLKNSYIASKYVRRINREEQELFEKLEEGHS